MIEVEFDGEVSKYSMMQVCGNLSGCLVDVL